MSLVCELEVLMLIMFLFDPCDLGRVRMNWLWIWIVWWKIFWTVYHLPISGKFLNLRRRYGRRRRPESYLRRLQLVLGFMSRCYPRVPCVSFPLVIILLTCLCVALSDDVVCHVLNETMRFTYACWMLIVLCACMFDRLCFVWPCLVCIDLLVWHADCVNDALRFDV